MAISELQMALIAAGVAAVAMVWGYNIWQDRKHSKTADRIFKGDQGDALLPDAPGPETSFAARDAERQEPRFAEEAVGPAGDPAESADVVGPAEALAADAAREPLDSAPPPVVPGSESRAPDFPVEYADSMADCVLHLLAASPISAPALRDIQSAWAGELSKPVHWLARKSSDGLAPAAWQVLDAHDSGRYSEWAVAIQLADRRGALSEGELARFFDGVQQLAQQTSAALELPSRGDTAVRAAKLDEFCAAVDIQFVLHIVEASGGVFAGSKLRGVAEAAGLALEADGVFRARDSDGSELFTVANIGAERLEAGSIKSLATHGLTLSLDVPRVGDGMRAFDRMLATARQLAAALGGVLVDAQRAPLADAMIAAIRAKTAELQQRMRDADIVPGSTRALRLFS